MSDKYPLLLPGGIAAALESSQGGQIVRGLGGRCWDQAGKKYIDFICGFGPLILGHCNSEVNQAVIEQMNSGMLFLSHSPLHDEFSAVLKGVFPYAERNVLVKTGSEGVTAAIRLARAFTGKTKLIRCGFHGWHEPVVSPHISWHQYELDSKPPRQVVGVVEPGPEPLVFTWDGDDLQQLADLFRTYRPNVAGLLLDPVQLREPVGTRLRELCSLVHDEEALLILDEIKTGFRVSLNGVQGLYGVQPDLTILSKGISNGFPLATVIGRNEIICLAGKAKIDGTYHKELLSIAASIKTLDILRRDSSIPWLWQIGQRLIDGINGILTHYRLDEDIKAIPYRWPCMPYVWFRSTSERAQTLKPRFYEGLIRCGVLLLPNHMNFTCLAHSAQDVDEALQIIEDSLSDCVHREY